MFVRAAMTSKALVNGAWREVVNIRSTKSVKKFQALSGSFRGDAQHRTRNLEVPGSRLRAPRNDCVGWLRLARDRSADRGLRRGKAGDRHAIGRAGDVVEADLVAEGDGSGIAAVLAADADLQIRPRLSAAL